MTSKTSTKQTCLSTSMASDTEKQLLQLCTDGSLPGLKELITKQQLNLTEVKDSSGLTLLHLACHHGQLDIAQYLINDQNCNSETTTPNGRTPLHIACKSGHLHIVKCLITDHKCNPHCTDSDGYTPLHAASESGSIETVKYLITEQGCDPQVICNPQIVTEVTEHDCNCSAQCSAGSVNTPLHCASGNGHLEVVKYLITEHKCNPEHCNVNGITPLHSAASNGHLAIVKYLISELGCNAQITTKKGLNPLHYACLNGHLDISKYLISDCNCNPQIADENGDTPLHAACLHGHLNVIKYLIFECTCNIQCIDKKGYTPFHFACINGSFEILEYLITEHKCSPDKRSNDGCTPLHLCASKGHLPVVKYLITQHHCHSQCTDKNGFTPLHAACSRGHLHVVKYLIEEHKCSCEPKGKIPGDVVLEVLQMPLNQSFETLLTIDGITPLHYACSEGHLDIVKYLISECDCNTNSSTSNGFTAVDFAQFFGHKEVVSYLEIERYCSSNISSIFTGMMINVSQKLLPKTNIGHIFSNCLDSNDLCFSPLDLACFTGSLTAFTMQSDQSSSNGFLGFTHLHIACMNGYLEIVKFLVTECNCDPNCAMVSPVFENINMPDEDIRVFLTPLAIATAAGHLEVVKWLVSEQKCELEYLEEILILPCMLGHLSIVKYLLSECTQTFFTPSDIHLFLACSSGHLDIVKLLINEYEFNPHFTSHDGRTPLHCACIGIQYLVEETLASENIMDNYTSESKYGIILFIWQGITFLFTLLSQMLSQENSCQKKEESNLDITNVWANQENRHTEQQHTTSNLDVVKYLINEHKCNPQCKDKEELTPLHYACISGKLEIVRYFHSEKLSDLVHTAHSGDTPLHFACKYDQVEIVRFLLSTGECDPLIKNIQKNTPVELATSQEICKQLDHFCEGKYPIESVVKVFVLGDPFAGKSSLVRAIQSNPGFLSLLLGQFQKVKGVRQQTVGIDSFSFSSSDFGYVVIYDFAGQREFHTSHAAFLQSYSTHMAEIFIVVTNISQCEDKISQSLHYWMSFIRDCYTHNQMKPHVLFVGSHADQLDKGDIDQGFTIIQQTVFIEHSDDTDKFYEPEGIVCLDCTNSVSPALDVLRSYLEYSCDSVRVNTEKIDQRCYVLHRYVLKTYTMSGAQEQTLGNISKDLEDNLYLLPSNPSELLPLFQTLHDKGQLILLQNYEKIQDSWVITNISSLLQTVVGSIFAPCDSPQPIAPGSTGIVPKSRMINHFPQLNIDMVIEFLEHFEFCHRVEPEWIDNNQSTQVMSDDVYYLFPALVTSETTPQVLQKSHKGVYYCRWYMYCTEEHHFFTTRFLQVLLLRLAFRFALSQDDATPSNKKTKAPALSRRCNMWKNGLSWHDTNGVKAVFEVKDLQTATVTMTCTERGEIYCIRLRTQLINTILKARDDFCPRVHVEECIVEIAGGDVQAEVECPSHSIKYLSRVIANRDPNDYPDLTLIHPDGHAGKRVSELLYFEPYAVFTPDLITQLFAKENAKKLVSLSFITNLASHMYPFTDSLELVLNPDPTILSEKYKDQVQSLGEKSRQQLRCKHILEAWAEQLGPAATNRRLRQVLNKYSIFSGRNPLELSDEFGDSSEDEDENSTIEKPSSYDQADRPTLIECIRFRGRERRINIPQKVGVKYYQFGVLLLEDDTGARIDALTHKYMNDAEQINTEALQQWINGKGKQPVTWETLTEVLRDIELNTLAGDIDAVKCHEDKNIGQVPIGISDDSVERDMSTVKTTEESKQSSTSDLHTERMEDVEYSESLELMVDIATDLLSKYFDCEDSEDSEKKHSLLDRNFEAELSAIDSEDSKEEEENQRTSVSHGTDRRTDTRPSPLIQDEELD